MFDVTELIQMWLIVFSAFSAGAAIYHFLKFNENKYDKGER